MSSHHVVHKLSVPSILIAFCGMGVSLYALVLHIQNYLKPGHGSLCDINAQLNCSAVIGSSYGEIAAIPLGSYGISYFVCLLAAAILPKVSFVTKKQHAFLELMLGWVGFLGVIGLFYISHWILKTTCLTCSIIHALVVIYFLMKLRTFIQLRNMPDRSGSGSSEYLVRFAAMCICLGVPPLAAGLIAPTVIENYFPSAIAPRATAPEKAAPSSTETPLVPSDSVDLTKFNKTNYVGDGEDYRRGSDDAKVVVQIFSDFGCPHCREANAPLLEAQSRVGLDKVIVVYRFFPLSNKCNPFVPSEGWYPYSCPLVQATRCAGAQGKFWEFKDWGFSGQEWTDEQRAKEFSLEGMKTKATQLGLNADLFTQCVEHNVELPKIKNDAALADKVKIKGTPLILINGHEYTGPHMVDDFARAMSR